MSETGCPPCRCMICGNLVDKAAHADADRLRTQLAQCERERDGWMRTAAEFDTGREFYQGLIRRIGERFGVAARTSDDGSVQDDVLALRVPELVDAALAESARLLAVLGEGSVEVVAGERSTNR